MVKACHGRIGAWPYVIRPRYGRSGLVRPGRRSWVKSTLMKPIVLILAGMLCFTAGQAQTTQPVMTSNPIRVAVWDTYVQRTDGRVMHFDILVPESLKDTALIHGYGRRYLSSKGQDHQPLTARECRFCHVRQAIPVWEEAIRRQGFAIIELENCD